MVGFNVELCTYEIVLKSLTGPGEREGFFLCAYRRSVLVMERDA